MTNQENDREERPLTPEQQNALEISLIEDYERKVELYGEDTDLWPDDMNEEQEADPETDYFGESILDQMPYNAVVCDNCHGTGWYYDEPMNPNIPGVECRFCDGNGFIVPPPSRSSGAG